MDLDTAIVDRVRRDAVTVPPYPAVAFKISEVVRRDDFDVADLVAIIRSDPTLAADLLRVANSAFYRRESQVTTLTKAVSWIGIKELVRLAIASGLAALADVPGPLGELRRKVWQDALSSAIICEALAQVRSLPGEEAFVCGLLHDFGRILAIACIEDLLRENPRQGTQTTAEWDAVVDRFHIELGLVLAVRWQLSDQITECISQHHSLTPADGPENQMVELVITADQIVGLMRSQAHVTADALALIPQIRGPHETALVAEKLPGIPGIIASFEGAGPQRTPAASKVSDPTAPPLHPLKNEFVVTIKSQKNAKYQARAIGFHRLSIRGKAPLAKNFLLELELDSEGNPFAAWAKVASCDGAEDGYLIELTPFALSGSTQSRWTEQVRAMETLAKAS